MDYIIQRVEARDAAACAAERRKAAAAAWAAALDAAHVAAVAEYEAYHASLNAVYAVAKLEERMAGDCQ